MSYRTVERDGTVAIEWLGESAHAAAALLGQPASAEERSELGDAAGWLAERLAAGPATAREVRRDARDAGFSERTLARAKAQLGVRSGKLGFGDGWRWELPPKDANSPKAANISDLASFAQTPVNTGVSPKDANASNISPARPVGRVPTAPEVDL